MKAAKDSGIPVRIYHAHGADIPFDIKWPIKYYCMRMLKYSMNEHFVCSEKAGRFYMGDKVIDSGNFHFIPNAIEVTDFLYNESVRNCLRKEYNLDNKLVIGHIGRFSLQKNHFFILKVFKQLLKINPSAHLVLVGDGEWHDKVLNWINELEINDYVTLTGVISNPQVWYQAFDVFFMPSLWEGLPVTGIEAQAADLPCLFSSAITREVELSPKLEFMSLKESENNWADKLNNMLLNMQPRKDQTALITKKHYNIEQEAKLLQELYIQLADNVNK